MSTRGACGFYKGGVTKAMYNHSDSYPSWLGNEMVKFCRNTTIAEMNEMFDKIVLVNNKTPVTKKMIAVAKKLGLVNTGVGNQSVKDIYCLFREAQGNLEVYKNPEMVWMSDSASFLEDSLFCEWAYIINLDTNMLEVYKGVVETPPANSRYYDPNKSYANDYAPKTSYYPVDMVAEFKLDGKLKKWDAAKVEARGE